MEILNCTCGKSHKCGVEQVVLENGAVNKLPLFLYDRKRPLVVADENTLGAFIAGGGSIDMKAADLVLFSGEYLLMPDEHALDKIKASVSKSTDIIVGIGGGTVNDLCKYIAYTHGLYYVYVATSPSMDGYASDGAALILDGMKVTLKTRPPHVIICDTEILKNAPIELIQSGVGDILGKFSCLNDWLLAAYVKGEYFCKEIYDRVYKCTSLVAENIEKILSRDSDAIVLLTRALVDVGVEMSYAGSSRPASGSEHHLAHFFEIHALEHGQKHRPHGIDVGCGSYFTAALRDSIIATDAVPTFEFERDAHFAAIKALLPRAAEGIIKLQNNTALHGNADGSFDLDGVKSVLKQAPTAKETEKMLIRAGLSPQELLDFYGKPTVSVAMKYGKELKDRFTVLWLYEYLGWGIFEV